MRESLIPLTYFRLTSSFNCSASSHSLWGALDGDGAVSWTKLRTTRPFPLAAVVVETVAVDGEGDTIGDTAIVPRDQEESYMLRRVKLL